MKQIYDHSWHKFASAFLVKHTECRICGKPAQCVDHQTIPAEIMMDMSGRFDLDPSLYQPLCYSCNRRKAGQDRDLIEQYFKDKEKLSQNVTPGGGVESSTLTITSAWSGVRDIEERLSPGIFGLYGLQIAWNGFTYKKITCR